MIARFIPKNYMYMQAVDQKLEWPYVIEINIASYTLFCLQMR